MDLDITTEIRNKIAVGTTISCIGCNGCTNSDAAIFGDLTGYIADPLDIDGTMFFRKPKLTR